MARRREDWRDTALRLAVGGPAPLRLWAARRAATRGLGVPALRGGAADPLVLARLGLHLDASEAPGGGRGGQIGRAAGRAARGDPEAARALVASGRRLADEDRRLLARAVALADPRLAAAILPEADVAARAACLVESGGPGQSISSLGRAEIDREISVVRAAAAASTASWSLARRFLNDAFRVDGLAPPLDSESAEPIALANFGETSPALAPVGGPLISVIVPAFDAAPTLDLAVGSLLAQTWRDLEVIVVDDGSTDATPAIAERLARRDPRVRRLANDRAKGAYGARNTGVEAARGAFIAFHDADDWAHPERLTRQMRSLGRWPASVARYFRLDGRGEPVSPRVFPLVRVSPMATLVRAEAWRAAGPFEEVALGADSEWLARFEERFGRRAVARTPAIGFVARWAEGSLSTAKSSGMAGAGLERRLRYERDWRFRHAGLA